MKESYLDPATPISHRVQNLISLMTIEEKISQMSAVWSYEVLDEGRSFSFDKASQLLRVGVGQITRIGGATNLGPTETAQVANEIQSFLINHTRLKIPAMIHEESCSGYMAKGATCFPQSIGIASTFEADIAFRIGEIIRQQMRSAGAHQALAPLLDVTRDPRWGRVEETFGEDPYLVAQMGMKYVEGLQGDDLRDGVIATGKHFVGYGVSEGGMNWAPSHIAERELHEVYLHPFEAVVRKSHLYAIMPGYHELDGIPCHNSKYLLTDLLRHQWGFDGIVVSDYFAVNMLHEYHHVAPDKKHAAKFAVEAGVDVELPSRDIYGEALWQALDQGLITMDAMDQIVSRILTMKFQLGLFETPYVDVVKTLNVFDQTPQRQIAYEAAQKSIILLKNEHSLLPIAKSSQKIAVIGPNADTIRNMIGDYAYPCHIESLLEMRDQENVFETPVPDDVQVVDQFVPMISILEAIRSKVTDESQIHYAKGCDIQGLDETGMQEAVQLAKNADVAIVVVGDRAGLTDGCTTGESRDRATLNLLGLQEQLVKSVMETGTPTIVVLVSGRPLSIPFIASHAPAIVQAWLPGEEGAMAIADVLFGDYNPAGRLPITVPRSVGQVPVYYAHKPSGGRSHWKGEYVDESNLPLFVFGHGLSYTKFDYTDLQFSSDKVDVHGTLEISCRVQNVGQIAGDEVVQLYIQDLEADVTRPVQELRGFCRVHLEPMQSQQVTFSLSSHQLGFYNRNMEFVVEPGDIKVSIGSSSADIRLEGIYSLTGETVCIVGDKVFTTPVHVQ